MLMNRSHLSSLAAAPLATAAQRLHGQLVDLRSQIHAEAQTTFERWRSEIGRRAFLPSAWNLAQYLAFRHRDLRSLQPELTSLGLSSLGRCESRVLPTIDAVLTALSVMADPQARASPVVDMRRFFLGERLLARETRRLFGPPPAQRHVRIMVTLPAEAASDPAVVRDLLRRGMDCARINCAHGDPAEWGATVRNLRAAEHETGRNCRVLMDLSGPRARLAATLSASPDSRVRSGDRILLTSGSPRPSDEFPLQAQCAPPGALACIRDGARVMIDEGKIVTVAERRVADGWVVRVLRTQPKGGRFVAEKGLNFPDSTLELPPLGQKDLADLDAVVELADIVGYSFVQEVVDVDRLFGELARRGPRAATLPVSIKVETARAVRNLPELIVRTGGRRSVAVMIARGDLAVELGYERLAEMQEELLWVAEAAHVPVIWATQVLERLVKKGTPSRAEITDAAMAVRAECVMLNKGPCILKAVEVLDDVLRRMQEHQSKKTPQLRALRSWVPA